MDRILKEEKKYVAAIVAKIVKSGANVVLIQKSILRDATNDLSLHFLAKKGIMVVKDIERDDIEFISKVILFPKNLVHWCHPSCPCRQPNTWEIRKGWILCWGKIVRR